MRQYRQPTQSDLSQRTGPSFVFRRALTKHAEMQAGSLQWLHCVFRYAGWSSPSTSYLLTMAISRFGGRYRLTPTRLVTKEVTVSVKGWPIDFEGLSMAVLADPHTGPYNSAESLQVQVDRILELRPDIIALLGDYFSVNTRLLEDVRQQYARLHAPHGVYAILGNHKESEPTGQGNIDRYLENSKQDGVEKSRIKEPQDRPPRALRHRASLIESLTQQ